jgi:hypothetical protein
MELVVCSNKDFGSISSVISLNIQKVVTVPHQAHGFLPEIQNHAVGVAGLGMTGRVARLAHPRSYH